MFSRILRGPMLMAVARFYALNWPRSPSLLPGKRPLSAGVLGRGRYTMVLKDPILNASPAHGAVFHLQSAPHTNVPIKKDRGGLTTLKLL